LLRKITPSKFEGDFWSPSRLRHGDSEVNLKKCILSLFIKNMRIMTNFYIKYSFIALKNYCFLIYNTKIYYIFAT